MTLSGLLYWKPYTRGGPNGGDVSWGHAVTVFKAFVFSS